MSKNCIFEHITSKIFWWLLLLERSLPQDRDARIDPVTEVRPTALPHPRMLDTAAGLGYVTPRRPANDMTIRRSITEISWQYSTPTPILTFDLDPDLWWPWVSIPDALRPWLIHVQKLEFKGESIQKIQCKQTDWRTGSANCFTFPAKAVGNNNNWRHAWQWI